MLGIRFIDELILLGIPITRRFRITCGGLLLVWHAYPFAPTFLIDSSTTVSLFVIGLLHFTLSPGLGHFIAATARADSIIVLGFDLLLVGQVRKI